MTKTKQTESVIGILINSKTHSLCNVLFYFDFRATLPLEMSLLSHTYTFIVHLSEQMLFFVQVSTETFSSNIVVVVTSCSHMPSQLQSIYHSQNPPPHYQKLYENESNTHIQTQTHVLNYTNALTYKYKYSQLTLTDLSLSYLYYCRNTFTHPNNPYTNKLVSCGRL